MVSNRHYPLKLGGAILVILLMTGYAGKAATPLNPGLWWCLALPERWNDRTIWLPFARIVSVRESDYEVGADEGTRIRVVGRAPAEVGDAITMIAVFRADGPRLEPLRSRVLPRHVRLRWLVEAVSVLVALGVLGNFARHFVIRPKELFVQKAP